MNRKKFNVNDILTLRHYEGSKYIERNFTVVRIMGEGASCITYMVTYEENKQYVHSGIIKEFNPINKNIKVDKFLGGYELQSLFRNKIEGAANITSNTEGIYEGYNKKYILMSCDEGISYDNIDEKSLEDIIKTAIAVTNAVKIYHDSGYLHLDVKPENIFILPETREIVKLFDFDSVHKKEELSNTAISYSKKWAAFELVYMEENYKICEATDIYSIGAIIFYKIMGRIPNDKEKGRFSKYQFNDKNLIFQNINPRIFKMLTILFRKTLNEVVSKRYKSAEELMEYLEEILKIIDKRNTYLVNMRWSMSNNATGRDNEISEIHKRLQDENTVFIRSMGGIGKSELAKMYAKKYKDAYNTIQFLTFDKSLKYTISNNLMFANFSEKDYKEVDIFKEKLKLFESFDANTLIVIDNFNVSYDEDIDKIITNKKSGHKVIFTTRNFNEDYENFYLELGTLNEEMCLKLYYDFLGSIKKHRENSIETIKEILEVIKYNTLLIKLIALNCKKQRIKPEIILEKLKSYEIATLKGKIKHISDNDKNNDGDKLMYEHLCAVFDVAGLKKNEKFIMMNLSLVGRTKIDVSKFYKWCGLDNFDDINSLVDCGWIELDIENDMISLHHIISDVSYEELKPDGEKCDKFIKSLLIILKSGNYRSNFEKRQYNNFSLLVGKRIIPKGECSADFFTEIGKILSLRENDKEECTKYLQNAEKIYIKLYGRCNEKVAYIYYILGIMYRTFACSFNMFYEENNESDEDVWNNLTGFFDKYIKLAEKVFENNLENLAESYLEVGKAYKEMFLNICCFENDKEVEISHEAEKHYIKFFETKTLIYKNEHKNDDFKRAADIMWDFYSDFSNPKHSDEKSCYFKKKYIDNKEEYLIQDDDKNNIEYYLDMGESALIDGNEDKALEYYKKSLQFKDDKNEIFYSHYVAYNHIIKMYKDKKEYDNAIKYCVEMQQSCKLKIDQKAESYYLLATVNFEMKEYELAKKNLKEAIVWWKNTLEDDQYVSEEYCYKEILVCKLEIAKIYMKNHQYEHLEKSLNECLKLYNKIEKSDKDMIRDIYGLYEIIGDLYVAKKDYNTAYENYIKEIDKLLSNTWIDINEKTEDICINFLNILKEESKLECEYIDLINNYNGSLKNYKDKIIQIYIRLGKIYYNNDLYIRKSLEYFNKALESSEEIYGTEHYITSKLYNYIGEIYAYKIDDSYYLGIYYKKKCNYKLIAVKESKEYICNIKKQFEIFEHAGKSYNLLDKYYNAIQCFIEAKKFIINKDIRNDSKDDITYYDYIRINDCISYDYGILEDYDKAIECEKETLNIIKRYFESEGYYSSKLYEIVRKYIEIAELYYRKESFDSSVQYYIYALQCYENGQMEIDEVVGIYKKIINIYSIKMDEEGKYMYEEKLRCLIGDELELE